MSAFVSYPDLVDAVTRSIEPPSDLKPSQWAEAHVVLTRVQTHRPGPYSCQLWPWLEELHDLLVNEPHKRGLIAQKPAQVGFTRAMLNLVMYWVDTRGGNVGFCIKERNAANKFASDEFDLIVKQSPYLQALFATPGGERRETIAEKPHRTGSVIFMGAGSAIASLPYALFCIDEYDVFMDNYPSQLAGDGWTMAQARGGANRAGSKQLAWSHPRRRGEGINGLYRQQSDMRAWVWDCPHCARMIDSRWEHVQFELAKDGSIDPLTAVYKCPHCACIITDGERVRACQNRKHGGTARFELVIPEGVEIDAEAIARREYIGVRFHRLTDPTITVAAMATEFAAKHTEEERMAWLNMQGEEYASAGIVVSEELVRRTVQQAERIVLPGDPRAGGVAYLVCGVDVQAPRDNPTLYATVSGFTTRGHELVVAAEKLKGWGALAEFLRAFEVPISRDGHEGGSLPIALCAIDCGYETGQVFDFVRRTIIPGAGVGAPVKLVAVRFAPYVKAGAPAIEPSEDKRTDPTRPNLGPLELRDLHRHTWVDRAIRGTLSDTPTVRVLCKPPPDWLSHHTANALTPVTDQHGNWDETREEWARQKDRRDDWLMARVFAIAGAALWLKLDRLYELIAPVMVSASALPPRDGRPGWISGPRRGGGGWMKRK